MFNLNSQNKHFSKCASVLALVLIFMLFIASVVNAVPVPASYSTGGGGGGGTPPPSPPPPPPADTTPPIISGMAGTDLTSSSARITWTTDETSTSLINY